MALIQGARREEIEAVVDRVLGDTRRVVPLVAVEPGETFERAVARTREQGREPRYSAAEMVAIERDMLRSAEGGRDEGEPSSRPRTWRASSQPGRR